MVSYIKSVLMLLLAGALVVLFLSMGLAILAAAAITLPFVYWYYRWKINRKLEDLQQDARQSGPTIIDADYEIVDEDSEKEK